MKLCRHLIVLGAAAGLVMPGCTPEEETLIDTGEILTLTASAKEITLKESDGEKEALKLTWTPASNYGLEEEVYYTLEIASADTEYADGFSRDMGKSTFSITWTGEELNTFLTEQFEAESGTMEKYKARITATIYGRDDLTQTAETEFSAKTYTSTSYTLYINGSALADPTAGKMTLEDAAGQFSWTGVLKEGNFVFSVSEDSKWPAYCKGESENSLKKIDEAPSSADDISIEVAEIGEYKVTADLIGLTYSIESYKPVPENLFITGTAVDANDYVNAKLMTRTEAGVFTYTCWMEDNDQFKFLESQTSWWPAFVRDGNSSETLMLKYFSSNPGTDYDLNFTYNGEAGWKLITANTNTMTVTIVETEDPNPGEPMPETLMIGGTALGKDAWLWDGSRIMTQTETGFTWTGEMTRGTFRFAAQHEEEAYWPGYKRNSQSEDYWTITSLNYNEFDDVLPDVGFTVLKTGKYTVTVDFLTYKVNLELVEEHETTYEENLYILFASEWDNDPVRTEMKKESEGIFSWEGFVTVGGHDKIADGEFQIFTSPEPGNWWPRYTLTYTNDPDYKNRIDLYSYDPTMSFDIEESGEYRIVINLVEMTYEITPIDSPEQGSGVGFDTTFEGENDIVLPDRHI